MLIDILREINEPLTRENFAKILYNLIQPDCAKITEYITQTPYNRLKPILNEQYTLTFIGSLKKAQYDPEYISSILAHLYQYSYVSSIEKYASLQLQPQVNLSVNNDGKYILYYKTFHIENNITSVIYINDFKFITEPIEFVEQPCNVPVPIPWSQTTDLEILYSHEKCDQYLSFQLMLQEADAGQPNKNSTTTTSRLPSAQRQARLAEINKTSKEIFTRAYWIGYYYYNTNIGEGFYLFDKNK